MTDAQQAQKFPSLRTQLMTAAHEFSVYLPEPLEPGDCDELMHILEPRVTALLAARERAVWLKAAKLADDLAEDMIVKKWNIIRNGKFICRAEALPTQLAEEYRQQAEAVGK